MSTLQLQIPQELLSIIQEFTPVFFADRPLLVPILPLVAQTETTRTIVKGQLKLAALRDEERAATTATVAEQARVLVESVLLPESLQCFHVEAQQQQQQQQQTTEKQRAASDESISILGDCIQPRRVFHLFPRIDVSSSSSSSTAATADVDFLLFHCYSSGNQDDGQQQEADKEVDIAVLAQSLRSWCGQIAEALQARRRFAPILRTRWDWRRPQQHGGEREEGKQQQEDQQQQNGEENDLMKKFLPFDDELSSASLSFRSSWRRPSAGAAGGEAEPPAEAGGGAAANSSSQDNAESQQQQEVQQQQQQQQQQQEEVQRQQNSEQKLPVALILPLGTGCASSVACRSAGMRSDGLPFDWVLSSLRRNVELVSSLISSSFAATSLPFDSGNQQQHQQQQQQQQHQPRKIIPLCHTPNSNRYSSDNVTTMLSTTIINNVQQRHATHFFDVDAGIVATFPEAARFRRRCERLREVLMERVIGRPTSGSSSSSSVCPSASSVFACVFIDRPHSEVEDVFLVDDVSADKHPLRTVTTTTLTTTTQEEHQQEEPQLNEKDELIDSAHRLADALASSDQGETRNLTCLFFAYNHTSFDFTHVVTKCSSLSAERVARVVIIHQFVGFVDTSSAWDSMGHIVARKLPSFLDVPQQCENLA